MSQPYVFEPTYREESVARPGVTFILNRMTEDRKIDLLKKLAASSKKLREIIQESARIASTVKEGSSQEDKDLVQIQQMALRDDITLIDLEETNPAYIRWGLAGVEGLRLAGGTEGNLSNLNSWPSELTAEARQFVEDSVKLTEQERKNLRRAITSGEVKQPTPELSIVQPVSATEDSAEKTASIPS